jgi:putative tryptophan/tyrosine transport system substrate-binding protein
MNSRRFTRSPRRRSAEATEHFEAERLRQYAAELVALGPDVIVTVGSIPVAPMQQATRTIPIVFTGLADPVGAGIVQSLARPGGNATGLPTSNMPSAASGWSCSRRSRLA